MSDTPDVMTSQLPCPICLLAMEKEREYCVKCHLAMRGDNLTPIVLRLLKRIQRLEAGHQALIELTYQYFGELPVPVTTDPIKGLNSTLDSIEGHYTYVTFDPHNRPWPQGFNSWQGSTLAQPRDCSWGYMATEQGIKHVWAGDLIITPDSGVPYPMRPYKIDEIARLKKKLVDTRNQYEKYIRNLQAEIRRLDGAVKR